MVQVKDFKIVRDIMAVLKMDEPGQLNSFFEKETRKFKRAIKGLQSNLRAMELHFEQESEARTEAIEDAELAVEDAYKAVTLDDIKTNEAKALFSVRYWGNIKDKEDLLDSLKKKEEKAQEKYDESVKEVEDQIAKYNKRINKISKK